MEVSLSARHWLGHLILALVCALFLVGWRGALNEKAQAEAATAKYVKALKAADAATTYRGDLLAKRKVQAAAQAASVSAALASAPDWANAPVPQEVQDALP